MGFCWVERTLDVTVPGIPPWLAIVAIEGRLSGCYCDVQRATEKVSAALVEASM